MDERPPFTPVERALVERLRTPVAVQRWLRSLPYNWETGGETLRSFRQVVRLRTAHCLEAALAAAVVLEGHGFPPLLLSFESQDKLDHVLFVFRQDGRWGSVARSRDPGLHGRKPVFRSPRQLAASYQDAYVDLTGRVTGYAVADLRELGALRLAAVVAQRVEGGEVAGRLSAPAAAHAGGPLPAGARALQALPGALPGPGGPARLLRGKRKLAVSGPRENGRKDPSGFRSTGNPSGAYGAVERRRAASSTAWPCSTWRARSRC